MPTSAQTGLELEQGSLFAGRYRIEGVLGRGGMGCVYRARDLYLAEPVGLKLLPIRAMSSPALALRFRQEVKLARRASHPNVIRVHDIGEEDGVLFFTMELIEGSTLRQLLGGKALPAAQAGKVARAIAEGLAAAHAEAIIHRDLKPSNVLIDTKGRVVLTDFGIARLVDDELSLTQGPIGTPSDMAPEQASSGPVDARVLLPARRGEPRVGGRRRGERGAGGGRGRRHRGDAPRVGDVRGAARRVPGRGVGARARPGDRPDLRARARGARGRIGADRHRVARALPAPAPAGRPARDGRAAAAGPRPRGCVPGVRLTVRSGRCLLRGLTRGAAAPGVMNNANSNTSFPGA